MARLARPVVASSGSAALAVAGPWEAAFCGGSEDRLGPATEPTDRDSANASMAIRAFETAATASDREKPISSIITKADPIVPVMAPSTLATYR